MAPILTRPTAQRQLDHAPQPDTQDPLSDIDLRRADLSHADLQEAMLRGVRLQGANIRAAHLQMVDLSHAQLQEARANAKTVWPDGFDWKAAGVRLLDD